MAILKNQNSDINSFCKYAIVTNTLEPAIYHLTQSTYLLNNIESYTIKCGRKEKMQIDGCKSCVITIEANCSWTDGRFWIPKSLSETPGADRDIKRYTTNIPLILKFFNAEDLATLKGDSLLLQEPE